MIHFKDWEIEQLNALKIDEASQPYFDSMRYCLRWFDEEPEKLGGESYENFTDLLIARSYIHLGKPRNDWHPLLAELWDEALAKAPNWPGFKRLSLNSKDRAYFEFEFNDPPGDCL
jgi:hypothetical protein